MFNVKSKQDYDGLSWEDKLRYNEQNRGNQYAKDELKRTESVLYSNPTDSARNWYAQQKSVLGGGSAEDAILGNFNRDANAWQRGKGIRGELNQMGVSDDRIGYSGGKVTLDGREFMEPDAVADGRSYASEDAIKNALVQYNQKNNVVPARSYINSRNPNIGVGWDGNLGQVKVGSVLMQPDYIQDGVAYVSRAKVDEAIAKEQGISGMYGRQDILNQSNDRWERRIDRLYDKVENAEPFSYSASDDPLYQEFRREYMKNAKNQYDDTIAKLNTQSGGAPSLGAMAAAWNLYEDSLEGLDAYKQQFRQQAYNEYMDERNQDIARLETAMGLRDDEFNRAYGVNSDIVNDRYIREDWERQLMNDEISRRAADQAYYQSEQMFPYELGNIRFALEQNKALAPYELQLAIQKVRAGELELSELELNNLITQAKLNGMTFSSGRDNAGVYYDPEGATPIEEQTVPTVNEGQEFKRGNAYFENMEAFLGSNLRESQSYQATASEVRGLLGSGKTAEEVVRYIAGKANLAEGDRYKILSNPALFGLTQAEMDEILKSIE